MTAFNETERYILTAIRDAVIAQGEDYVYAANGEPAGAAAHSTCYYLAYNNWGEPTGEASCIIGHGLLDSRVDTIEHLRGAEGCSAEYVVPVGTSHGFGQGLRVMQEAQDEGIAWGEAYARGLNHMAVEGYDVSEFRFTVNA